MAEERTIHWTGQSGAKYKYWITSIGSTFKPEPGNYVFAKESQPHEWSPIYVGETGNLEDRLTPNHEKMPCIKKYGGTHVCTHTNSSEESVRQKEEADIIEKWNPSCNLED